MRNFNFNFDYNFSSTRDNSINDLKKGQLLFCSGNSKDLLNVSGNSQWKFDHVAIVLDKDTVIEAVPWLGVTYTKMDKFIYGHNISVATVRDTALSEKAVEIAVSFIGAPYNRSFEDNTKKGFYCSSLIAKSFEIANGGTPYFKEDTLNFKNSKGEISESWINYYRKLNRAVPHGQRGSHPSRLYADNKIINRHVLEKSLHCFKKILESQ